MFLNMDTSLCEWCGNSNPATAVAILESKRRFPVALCNRHAQEAASDFTTVNLLPLPTNPYSTLESVPSEMKDWTVAELERAHAYGVPYPVCGDLTAKKRGAAETARKLNAAVKLMMNSAYGKQAI